jgi:hypothetical protein
MRAMRAAIIGRLTGVERIDQIPFDIVSTIRQNAVSLLRDPKAFPYQNFDCGGTAPNQPPRLIQETRIGRYE